LGSKSLKEIPVERLLNEKVVTTRSFAANGIYSTGGLAILLPPVTDLRLQMNFSLCHTLLEQKPRRKRIHSRLTDRIPPIHAEKTSLAPIL
jgi:hypothetical protein